MNDTGLREFQDQIETELRQNILAFWIKHAPDTNNGGFHGYISNDLITRAQADKGIILNTRILWTFSHAFRLYREEGLKQMAERAYSYITQNFFDREFGGVFWTVDHLGRPLDTRKRIYAQAFAVYALSEYFLATGKQEALDSALELFHLIEGQSRDRVYGGYFETYEREWRLAADQRLSEVDQDDSKSMNTHLHVLEAYAGLARARDDAKVKAALSDVIEIFLDHILDPATMHFRLFFDEDWTVKSDVVSFGHDIEGSWLLCEAAEIQGDQSLLARVKETAVKMAGAILAEAIDEDGALVYEADPAGIIDYDRHWWPQAETVVGFINAYQLTGREDFLGAALECWNFIDSNLIDKAWGEWFWKVSRAGTPDQTKPKVDQWKGPYHNGRMCFEVLSRLKQIEGRPDEPK